jgi:hypothetical protein
MAGYTYTDVENIDRLLAEDHVEDTARFLIVEHLKSQIDRGWFGPSAEGLDVLVLPNPVEAMGGVVGIAPATPTDNLTCFDQVGLGFVGDSVVQPPPEDSLVVGGGNFSWLDVLVPTRSDRDGEHSKVPGVGKQVLCLVQQIDLSPPLRERRPEVEAKRRGHRPREDITGTLTFKFSTELDGGRDSPTVRRSRRKIPKLSR